MFDPGLSAAGGTDGSGNWDPTTQDWFNVSSGLSAFGNTTADTAVFGSGGTAGTVTVDASVTVGTIQFNTVTGTYSVTNSNAATITLGGAATINTNGVNASIGAGILKLATGTTAFNKTGLGTLFLTGDNSGNLPGGTTLNISGGTLNATTGLYNSAVQLDSGRANGASPTSYNLNGGSIVLNSSSGLGFASGRTINVLAGGGAISDGGFVQGSGNAQGAFVPNFNVASGATLDVVATANFSLDAGGGVISGAGGVTTYGTGTVQLLQANTYTGGTNISGGTTVSVTTIANTGTASGLGAGTGNLVIAGTNGTQNSAGAGATLLFTGTTGSTNRGLTLTGTVQNTINVSSGTGNLTISGPVNTVGLSGSYPRFYKEGAGTLSFTNAGTNNFNGYKFLVDGGTLNFTTAGQIDQLATDLIIGNQLSQANTSPVLNLAGATINIGNISGIGNGFGIGNGDPNNNQVLTFNMSGGTLNTPTIYTNYNTAATGLTANMNVSGGTVNCSNGLFLQNVAGGTTVLNLSGTGTAFNVSGTATLSGTGTTVVNQTGGTLTSAQALSISTGGTATYNLTGGTLAVPAVNQSGGTGTLNWNGGTLQATANATAFLTGLTAASVQGAGAVIDTQAFNVSVGQPLLAGTTTTGGGLTKVGTGTLALSGSSTYVGATTINAGTLQANGPRTLSGTTLTASSTGTGTVTIASGATLAGNGGTGAVVVSNGAKITAGSGATAADTVGTLTTGTQTWNSGGTFTAKAGSTDGANVTSNDQLVMSGLTVAATTTSKFNVNVIGLATNSAAPAANATLVLADDTDTSAANPFNAASGAAATTLAELMLTTPGLSTAASGAYQLSTQADTSTAGGFDLILTTTAAPEPTSLLLLGGVAAPLALGRRRRRALALA